MLNYIQSELYRITHTRPVYILTVLLSAGIVAINLVLHFFGGGASYYGQTSFSYSFNISEPFLYIIMGAIVAFILYEPPCKNGNLKNTVAYGASRTQIFISQCIVALIAATIIMLVVLAVWVASAELLLAHTTTWTLGDFFSSSLYVYLLAVAGLISAIVLLSLFQREMTSVMLWLIIWNLIPMVFHYLGMKFDLLANIASWMSDNFFTSTVIERWWENPDIFERALVSGVCGILIFTVLGLLTLRRKDL